MTDAEKLAEFVEVGKYLIEEYNLADRIYEVRDRADMTKLQPDVSSWDHPDVAKFSDMYLKLRSLVAAEPERQAALETRGWDSTGGEE